MSALAAESGRLEEHPTLGFEFKYVDDHRPVLVSREVGDAIPLGDFSEYLSCP
jgi:hypothetical protein